MSVFRFLQRLRFKGFSCEKRGDCAPFDDTHNHYYAINSDGTDLERLQISSFPPAPALPEGAPPLRLLAVPHISPDGSTLAYVSDDRGLYVVNRESGKATLLFQPQDPAGSRFYVGPVCWSPDGTVVRFAVHERQDNDYQPPVFYAVNQDGSDLRALFTLPALKDMSSVGDCSPDGREVAIPIPESHEKERTGLYIVNLDDGTWRHILTEYNIMRVRAESTESSP